MTRMGILTLAAVTLSGCVLIDGSRRSGPDEFGVVTRAPLSRPPDFALRPPRAGAPRPNEVSPREEARSHLFNAAAQSGDSRYALSNGANGANGANGSAHAGLSPGEHALLKHADALDVDPNIRILVDRESGRVDEDDSLVEKLVFWGNDESDGKPIDAQKEAERLRRNAALGVPAAKEAPQSR